MWWLLTNMHGRRHESEARKAFESRRSVSRVSDIAIRSTARRLIGMLVVNFSLALLGCASNPSTVPRQDPWESFNRDVDRFNMAVDRSFIRPVSEAYARVTPEPIRASVTHFFDNLGYPGVIFNNLLQGKIVQGGQDMGRMLVNTTLGIGGLFDIASRMNLPRHEEDLGQTLCVWGVPEGAYLVLPLWGPTTVRDLAAIPGDILTSLLTFARLFVTDIGPAALASLGAFDALNTRTNLSGAIRIREQALDPYVFTREAYLQRRLYLCYDGDPPLEDFDEFDDFDDTEFDDFEVLDDLEELEREELSQ